MNCWLVIDLRANRFAAAILTLASGKTSWQPQKVRIYPLRDIYNDVTETDLTFYRQPDEKNWIPTLRSSIGDLPKDFEIIPALLDEPAVRLQTLLTRNFATLLKDLLKEYQDIPLLFLIDRDHIQTLLVDFASKAHRKSLIYLAPDQMGDIEGFALLDPGRINLPTEESIVSCVVEINGNGVETRYYRWSHHHFKQVKMETTSLSPQSKWDSAASLQRAGLAMFSLVWQERLVVPVENEINLLEQENNTCTQIIYHMQRLLKQLGQVQSLNGI